MSMAAWHAANDRYEEECRRAAHYHYYNPGPSTADALVGLAYIVMVLLILLFSIKIA